MNTDKLAKLYPHLTARERLPLIIAAQARDDQLERRRLEESAPTGVLRVPDYYDLGQALDKVADWHVMTLLDVAATFWQWWGLWGWQESADAAQGRAGQARRPSKKKSAPKKKPAPTGETQREFRRYCQVRYHAYLFTTHVDAWKLFCADWVIDPEVLFRDMPCWDTITRTETQTRTLAFSHQDAAMFLLSTRRDKTQLPQIVTVDGLVKVWHEIIAGQL